MPTTDRTGTSEMSVRADKASGEQPHHDGLRAEVFSPKSDKVSPTVQALQTWQNTVRHLETASAQAENSDFNSANTSYQRAFRNADLINQDAVDKERQELQLKLKDRTLDETSRRKFIELDSALRDIQRGPGVVLANWGLALIRNGHEVEGTQLLLKAQSRDSAMKDDPNFKRHFDEAYQANLHKRELRQVELSHPASTSERDLPSGFPQPVIHNSLKPAGEENRSLNKDIDSTTGQFHRTAATLATNKTEATAGQTEISRQSAPDAASEHASQFLLETNKKFQATAKASNNIEAYKQLAGSFVHAINLADQEFAAKINNHAELFKLANKPVDQISPAQKLQIEQAIIDLNPALEGRFVTRLCLSQAADLAGDKQQSVKILTEAFASIPAEYQIAWLQKSPDLVAYAQKLGINLEKLPVQPDQLLAQSIPRETRADSHEATNLSPANQGLRPDQMWGDAEDMLKRNGMTPETKKQFEDAIRATDALFNQSDINGIQIVQSWLRSGQKDNGQVLTPKDRIDCHDSICKSFDSAFLGLRYREVYGALLVAHKQNATAEKTFLDKIEVAEKLPLRLIRDEMDLLARDMANPNFPVQVQKDLSKRLNTLGGTTLSRDDGLLNAPIEARKSAAQFYMSRGTGESQLGVFKPDKAIEMINDTKSAELRIFGVDLNKNPNADPTLLQMASSYGPFASEQLRSDKGKFDTYWTNGVIDIGVGAASLTAAGLLATIATKNPKFFSMALNAEKTALSLGGKAALAGTTVIGATSARHYLHKEMTGLDEGWDKSLYHASAGLGTFAAVYGARSALNQTLFRGASEETLFLRYANSRGAAAGLEGAEAATAQKMLSAKEVGEYYAAQNIRVPQKTLEFIKSNPEALVVNNGIIQKEAFEAVKLGLNPAHAVTLAYGIAPQKVAAELGTKSSLLSRMPLDAISLAPLDLTTASASQLSTRAVIGTWAQASAGIGANSTLTALDRKVDPTTGKMPSLAEAVWDANYETPYNNTLVKGLLLSPLFRNGAVPKNFYAQDATFMQKIKGTAKAPFTANGWGAATSRSSYMELGKQAGYVVTATNIYDFETVPQLWSEYKHAQGVQKLIDTSNQSVTDQRTGSIMPAIPIPEREGLAAGTPGL